MDKRVKRFLSLVMAVAMSLVMFAVPALAHPDYDDTLKDGHKYTIVTALDTNVALDLYRNDSSDGTKLQLCGSHWGDSQVFTIANVYGEWYKIVHTASGKVLDIEGGSSQAGANVILWSYHGGDNQLWKFVRDGQGYRIQSKLGTFLAVRGFQTKDETKVWADSKSEYYNQLWHLDDLTKNPKDARLWDSSIWRPSYTFSERNLPKIYVEAGETITQEIQLRGDNITFVDITWFRVNVPFDPSGLSIKPVSSNSYSWFGGMNNAVRCSFNITADSRTVGLYKAKVQIKEEWVDGYGYTHSSSYFLSNSDFYIYVY